MRKKIYFFIPIIAGIVFVIGLNKFLDYRIAGLLETKNLSELKGKYADRSKDTGIKINDYFLKEDNIMMIGASDLEPKTKQNAPYFFNTNRTEHGLFTVGRPFVQEFEDTIQLGSLDPNIKDKKIVLLNAFSWYMYKGGIGNSNFQLRFSPIQFYAFLDNPKISDKNKEKMLKRCKEFLSDTEEYKSELLYIELYEKDNFIEEVESFLLTPYFEFRKSLVSLKEKGTLYLSLIQLNDKDESTPMKKEKMDWEKEFEQAKKDGKKSVNGNSYGLDDKYYKNTLSKQLKKVKNKYKKLDITKSKEIEDYEFFLDVCVDLDIKPTIVIIPGYPQYYEHTGISIEKQNAMYEKLEKMAKDRGFNVVSTSSEIADTEYYMRDVMHIGTVGWTDVSKKLYEIYEKE